MVKKKTARIVIKKKAAKAVVKKKIAKSPVIKKKVVRTIIKKKSAAIGSSASSQAKILRATIVALKDELKMLKNDLKSATQKEAAVSKLTSRRGAAVEKFLSTWDKKAMSDLDKTMKPNNKKKSR